MDIFSLVGKVTVNYGDAVKGIDEVSSKAGNLATTLGKNMQSAGQKITSVGKSLAPVSVAIGGVLGASTKSASDFTDGMAKMSTLFDTTKVNVGQLSKEFIGLSNETGKSATELAEAGYQALSASVPVEKLGGFVKTSANLAKVGFTDTATAVDVMTTAINAYGMETEDADKIANNLVRTQNLGKTTVNELASSMGKIIPTASSMNVNLDNLCTTYVTLTKQGIATAEATTYANSMLNEMGDSGTTVGGILKEQTGKSFQELMADGNSLGDVLVILQDYANETGTNFNELWGSSEAGKAAIALLNGGVDEFNNTLAEMESTTDLVGEGLEKLDTPSAKINKALNQVKNTGIELGSTFLTSLIPTITVVVGAIQKATTWFSGLSDGTKTVIATIMALIAVASPLLIIGGKVVSAIGTIITVVSKISGVVSGVIHVVSGAASFISGTVIPAIGAIVSTVGIVPIAIAAAVAAVIAVFVLLWNKCEGFREFWINLWEGIKSVVSTAIEGIKGFFSGILDFITNNWQGLLLLLANPFLGAFKLLYDNCEGFRTFIHGFLEGVKNIVSTVMGAIASIFTTIWNGITDFVVNVWEGIVQVGTIIFEGLAAFFTACWEGIKAVAVTIWTAISAFFGTIWEGIKTIVTTVVTAIQTFLATAWNTIKTVITTVLNAIKTVFSTVWGAIKTVVTTVMEAVKSFITTAWNAIKSIISNVLNGIKNVITTSWNAIKTTISNVLNGIKSVISSIWNSIKSVVTSVLNGIKNVITTVWNGIKTTISNLMNSIVSVFGTAWNGIKSTIGDVINGIKTAISNGLNGAKNVVVNVLSAIRDTFWNIFEGAANIVQNAIERIKNLFNFDWSLPQIKLPHFSINGQFSLNPPQIPSIGVEWYKKAMDGGMIMNQPTVFGYDPKANQLLAGGEAGSETVVGTKSLMQMIQSAVSSENDELIAVLHLILEAIYALDEGLGEKFYRALLNTRFQINEREFARLVKAV